MKTIVTGGAGFIGSHLIDKLLAEGHQVLAIDNFVSGQKSNIEHNFSNSNFCLVEADVADFDKIAEYFKSVDWVFHLAALADIVPSIERPLDYHHSNVAGTVSCLEAARKAGVKRFIYAASSSCYGIPDQYPTNEEAEIRPMYPYAFTKYIGERYLLHWQQVYGLPCVALRFFNEFSKSIRVHRTDFRLFISWILIRNPIAT